jgi:hypothetical protein
MLPRRLALRIFQAILFTAAVSSALAQEMSPELHPQANIVLEGLGHGTAELDGPWQFQLGDNPAYALPSFDDSRWESILPTAPWGAQGHPSVTGFAWYRRHIDIHAAPGAPPNFTILLPDAEDAYELYWNGKLIGHDGRFPPHASWHYSVFPHSFQIPSATSGVLAIRIWKSPLDIFSLAESGGLYAPPILGDADTISLYENAVIWSDIRQDLFDYSLILLRLFIAALCVLLWTHARREQLFLWVGVFTVTPVALGILNNLFFIPFSYNVARFINQPVYALSNIALWFLLLWLLKLNDRPKLRRLTIAVAWFTMAAGFADGCLALFWGSATLWMQWADGILAALILTAELYPFLLITLGLMRRNNTARNLVALTAFISQFLQTCGDASALGRRFTHWSLYDKLIDYHQLQIQGVVFSPQKVSSLILFAAILYAVYRYVLEQQARRTVLEQEMQSAAEIQKVLIPEKLPNVEGYAITSAYTPAQEVGGDFFQILAHPDGTAIIAVGDVSGKGLKAAMNVSMILGVIRAQAESTSSPAEIVTVLNNCLAGRMHGGFATGIIFRVDPDGAVTFSNAGHLPPFLNGQEFELLPSLPVGIAAQIEYGQQTVKLEVGDQLSFYTDGLLEARSASGELYGFERLHTLFAARPTAQQACAAAVAFGQDDDITVLTITRLAAGEEPTALLVASTGSEGRGRPLRELRVGPEHLARSPISIPHSADA